MHAEPGHNAITTRHSEVSTCNNCSAQITRTVYDYNGPAESVSDWHHYLGGKKDCGHG